METEVKVGICQWNLPEKGPAGCLAAAAAGLAGVELDYSEELPERTEAYIETGKRKGLAYPTLGMNVFCARSYTEPGGEAFFLRCVRDACRCAEKLGSRILQIPAFFASGIRDGRALETAAANLRAACVIAGDAGITVGTENVLTAEENERLFALVDRPELGYYFDTQNMIRMRGQDPRDCLLRMRDKLCEVHAKDSAENGSGAVIWAPLGEGSAAYGGTAALLKTIGYRGWILLENDYQNARPGYTAADFAAAAARDMRRIGEDFRI